jgi:hypothetical protein
VNTQVLRAMRVMAPNDARLIWRDGFLLSFLIVAMPLLCLWLNSLVPYVGDLVADWVVLEPYYGLILANILVAGEPVRLGFVIGILFIKERDEGTLLALQTSPLSLRAFLSYRLLAGMMLSILLTIIGVLFADLVTVSWLELIATAALASLGVPLVALTYAIFLRNKVQALMWLKPVQVWGGGSPPCSSSCPQSGSGSGACLCRSTTPCGCSGAPAKAKPSGGSWFRA